MGRLARGRVHHAGRRGCPWAATSSASTSPPSATIRRRCCTSTGRLLALRRSEPALSIGAWTPLTADGDLLAYERSHAGRRLAVVLNLGHEPLAADLPAGGRILLSTHLDRDGEGVAGRVELRPDEGVIVERHRLTDR